MYRSCITPALVALAVALAGCAEETPVSPVASAVDEGPPLVRAPLLTQSDLDKSNFRVLGAPAADPGPARAEFDEQGGRPIQQIFGPSTRADFGTGFASSIGAHRYIGNVGAVSTTASLSFQGQHVASRTSNQQDYTPFLLDWGSVKRVVTWIKIPSDHECGLSVEGQSDHRAWWQFFQGRGVAAWGVTRTTTQEGPTRQGACANPTGQTEDTRQSEGGLVCTYLITFDLETGEIVNAELLFCHSGGGEVI